MSTKAYYTHEEIGKGKPGFSKTRSIIEAAFYGNNVVEVKDLKQAYELAKNSPGTIVTDMPVYKPEAIGLDEGSKVLLFNDGSVTGRCAAQFVSVLKYVNPNGCSSCVHCGSEKI